MALETVANVETAVDAVFADLKLCKAVGPGAAQKGKEALLEVISAFRSCYVPSHVKTVADAVDADLATMLAAGGQLEGIDVGDVFEVTGTGDDVLNGLQAAKGGAVAAGDKFEKLTATTVAYLGAGFTFANSERADW